MINPYNIDFNNCEQIKSVSHEHIVDQEKFDRAIARGYRHLAISHYTPSEPFYPLESVPSWRWDATKIPSNVIGSPNSEKVKSINVMGHVNALGSFCKGYGTNDEETKRWDGVFEDILSQLQFEDGGGITLNHQGNSDESIKRVISELDYDSERVLGVEFYNNSYEEPEKRWFTHLWDSVLATGRRCWGFAVVDWDVPTSYGEAYGCNMLLVPSFTEHECLKAYRNGHFYGIVKDTGLRFNNIMATKSQVIATTNKNCEISVVTDKGIVKTVNGTNIDYSVRSNDIYVRIVARDTQDGSEFASIFSNPIMFYDVDGVKKLKHREKIKKIVSVI